MKFEKFVKPIGKVSQIKIGYGSIYPIIIIKDKWKLKNHGNEILSVLKMGIWPDSYKTTTSRFKQYKCNTVNFT